MKIKIEYDGSYPNLCSGQLIAQIEDKKWVFPKYCLSSGGAAYFTNNYADDHVENGPWSITSWPEKFPEELKEEVTEAVNNQVDHGCCGGCL